MSAWAMSGFLEAGSDVFLRMDSREVTRLADELDKHASRQLWLVRDVFSVLLAYPVAMVLLAYVENQMLGFKIGSNAPPGIYLLNQIIYAAIFSLLPIMVVSRYYNATPGDIGLTLKSFKKNLVIGLVGGLLILVVGSLTQLGIKYFLGESHDDSHVQMLKMSKDTISFFVGSFASVLLAPLSEEIFWRGFAYTIFKKHYGKIAAVLLSSLLFAGLHLDIWNAPLFFIMGIGFALLFERTGSLISGMTAHTIINLSTVGYIISTR